MTPEGKTILTISSKERILQVSYQNKVEKKIPFIDNVKEIKFEVKDGGQIRVGQLLFTDGGRQIASPVEGKIKIEKKHVILIGDELAVKEYIMPISRTILVKDGDLVKAGDQLTEGSIDLHQLYRLKGKEFTQKYVLKEIQHIYSSQGQKLNDKHIEVIARQMFSKVYIKDAGDSGLMAGEVAEAAEITALNKGLKKSGKKLVEVDQLLLGITKVSLSTQSWLAAASFQETSRVLINAAITGRVDNLSGLKENIIIGRLIPIGAGFKKKSQEK
ncbi:MAG: DNA-directed RNA polymerase subunit beta', partial [Patescibacteria group bacterium]